jgi:hypothetical protein
MKLEKQHLIHELLAGEHLRENTLLAATKILRRRRQWRVARQTFFALLLLAFIAGLLSEPNRPRPALVQISPPKVSPPAPLQAQALTDDKLLALFPNTPVALATLPNGKKLLIFPRPSDEAKFVTRL